MTASVSDRETTSSAWTSVEAAAAVPLLAMIAACLLVVTGWIFGVNPFWPIPEVTLTEAAATRDSGEVVRLIKKGHDPNRAWQVREGVLDDRRHVMKPLEAAIAIRRLDGVQLLLRHGARMSAHEREMLVVQAQAVGASDIVEYLETLALQ